MRSPKFVLVPAKKITTTGKNSGFRSLHPEIYAKCRNLFEGGDYAEAVEKSFKLVRDKLRALTGYETGSEAFGKGHLYIEGAAATHVDEDPIRAYEYLRLSSL